MDAQEELNKLHKAAQGPSVTNPVVVTDKKATKKAKSKTSWLKKKPTKNYNAGKI
jgi:hypothetical protein